MYETLIQCFIIFCMSLVESQNRLTSVIGVKAFFLEYYLALRIPGPSNGRV